MQKISFFSKYFGILFSSLSGKLPVGGLEISDTAIRYALRRGNDWILTNIRLPSGVMEQGRVVDQIQFLSALQLLRSGLHKSHFEKKPLPVVVTLSSAPIYTQAFSLQPLVSEKEFQQALNLNMQMISPIPLESSFYSSQILTQEGRAGKVEVLGAFVQRNYVTELADLVGASGFLPVAIEPKGVAIARALRALLPEYSALQAYVIVFADSDGVYCVVVRDGWLYFEFPVYWRDLRAEERDMNSEAFRQVVRRAVSQVRNYYEQHWQLPSLTAIYVAGGSATPYLVAALSGSSDIPVRDFSATAHLGQAANWLVALGSGVRGQQSRSSDEEVSVAGLSAKEDYFRRELINLFDFWQVLAPVVLTVLFLALALTRFVLNNINNDLEQKISQHSNSGPMQEIYAINQEAARFNSTISSVLTLESSLTIKTSVVERISKLMQESQVIPWTLSFGSENGSVRLTGSAPTYPQIQQFQRAMGRDPMFSQVEVPLSSIQQQDDGVYSFEMSLVAAFSAVAKASSIAP